VTASDPVAVVDDDAAVRQSIATLVRSHGLEAIELEDAPSLLAALERGAQISCVVSDVMMPGMTGLELQQELTRRGCRVPLVLVTGHGRIQMAVVALKAGAADFLEKPFDGEHLIGAIRRAIEDAGRRAGAERTRALFIARMGGLSKRQREVMNLVVTGLSSKEIAARLGISHRTVETYRLWIMERMEARNLADLVRMAMLVDPPADA